MYGHLDRLSLDFLWILRVSSQRTKVDGTRRYEQQKKMVKLRQNLPEKRSEAKAVIPLYWLVKNGFPYIHIYAYIYIHIYIYTYIYIYK